MLRGGGSDGRASQVDGGFALGASYAGESLYDTEKGDVYRETTRGGFVYLGLAA